jgi:outer membrane protein OmpA-like peptidoglycan-associated protein
MSSKLATFGLLLAQSVFVISVGFAMAAGVARAGDATEAQILNALTPKKLTRSLSAATPTPADTAKTASDNIFVSGLRGRTTRSLSSSEREQIATIAKEKPSIDLEITFDYNSAAISPKAVPAVTALGKALSNPDLKGSTFLLAGHTDAVGGDAFNQQLSERRAEAIKRYLIEKYGMATADLVAVGYGKSKLKDPNDPNGPENRRVQVVNMMSNKVAGN